MINASRAPLRLLTVAVIVLFGAVPSPLTAQPVATPTDGLLAPERSVSIRDDALSLELNPAGLAFIDGFDGELVFTSDQDGLDGTGLFLGYGSLGPFGFGGAIQYVDNAALGGRFKKFTLGFAARPTDRLSIGFAFNYFDSDVNLAVDEFSSWDAGLQFRLAEFIGLGVTVRDFNTPRLGGDALDPRYTLGAALRLAEGRYRLEFEGIHDGNIPPSRANDDPGAWFLRARALVEPLEGLTIFAETQSTPVDDFEIATLQGGLSFAFGPAAVSSAVVASFVGDAKVTGATTVLRTTSRPLRTVMEPSGFLAGVTLAGSLPERGRSSFLFGDQSSFLDLLVYLDRLSTDAHIDGLVLRLENVGLGLGQHWELRRALQRLQRRGKSVLVYLSSADFGDLYLASVADDVIIAPGTPLFPAGLSTTLTYLGDLFDNIGIEPEFVRIAEYKSAAEALMASEPSAETIEASTTYLDDVFEHMVARIAEGREMTVGAVRDLIDTAPCGPVQAHEQGIVDGVAFYDELEERLSHAQGRRITIVDGYDPSGWRDYRWVDPPRVAIVYVDGDIVSGASGQLPVVGQTTGHHTLVSLFEGLKHSSIEAIVVRIDSPGGSAFASEAIWRAIERVDERIPVVVSMGDVAASGGYYIAAAGREIMATDVTLTGSIGIFAGHFAARELLEWAGINRYPIARGANANVFGFDDPWTDSQREAVMRDISLLYDVFLERVADSRQTTPEAIDPIARGRIWSGRRARELGLVDEIGGLLDAIERAKVLAGLPADAPVTLLSLPERSGLSGLFSLLGVRGDSEISEAEVDALTAMIQALGLDRVLRIPLLYGSGRAAARLEFELEGLE